MELYKTHYSSPIGWIEISGSRQGIQSVIFLDREPEIQAEIPPCLSECIRQLDEYFHEKRKSFVLQLQPEGTEFQLRVWNQLQAIPYGETVSYLEIAGKTGNKNSSRAVGHANGQNPIGIIIPCHRVIGANGKLTGYGGGLWRKEWLLKFEKANTLPGLFKNRFE